MLVARWVSRGRAYWVDLYEYAGCYNYTDTNGGGVLGAIETDEEAIAVMQGKVNDALFQPDSAQMPMIRVL